MRLKFRWIPGVPPKPPHLTEIEEGTHASDHEPDDEMCYQESLVATFGRLGSFIISPFVEGCGCRAASSQLDIIIFIMQAVGRSMGDVIVP
jgi:hypothetical protein